MDRTCPAISVVVPAFEAEATMGHCVAALSKQTVPRDQYEILVVDDGSTDDTAREAQRAGADHVLSLQRNVGPAGARNAGINRARGDLIVFTDADCEPQPDFVASLTNALRDPGIAGAK